MQVEHENTEVKEEFKPLIVAFCCNWCSYAGADLAGTSRLSYPAEVKIIRVLAPAVSTRCLFCGLSKGRGWRDLCGCHPGDCHYEAPATIMRRRRMTLLFSLLDYIGVEKEVPGLNGYLPRRA